MDFVKYFKNTEYIENKNDCWTFIQEVFKDEHNYILPDRPILIDKSEIASNLITNIPYTLVNKAEKGCIVYYKHENIHHAGYTLNDKKFIHKTIKGVQVSNIPKNSIIYKVLND